jgi:hypothetical protein
VDASPWRIFPAIQVEACDPDGDTVAVDAEGIVQTSSGPGTIGITGVRDGGGGGIAVALATRSGSVPFRILLAGERIEVTAP